MDQRTTGIVATVAAVVLCGCPGLVSLCLGLTFAFAGVVPGSEIDIFGSNDPTAAVRSGIAALCIGLIFLAIPILVGYLTLRRRPGQVDSFDEPMPPAI